MPFDPNASRSKSFEPGAYRASRGAALPAPGFDPDAYLAKGAQQSTEPETMDVRLPDGSIVRGVPQGTTRAQLAKKLKANGYNVPDEWMTQYMVTGPDGTKYRVTGPAGASEEDVVKHVKEYLDGRRNPAVPAPAPMAPADTRSAARQVWDTVRAPEEMARTFASSIIAGPVSDVAGLAATGYEALMHGSHGDGEMPSRFRDSVRDRLTYHPTSPEAQSAMRTLGGVAAPIAGIGGQFADSLRGDGPANGARAMLANAGIEALKQAPNFLGVEGARAVPGVVSAGKRTVNLLSGATERAARGEAIAATRRALGDVEQGHAAAQAAKLSEAQAYEDAAARAQAHLKAAAQRTGTPTADVLGGHVRDAYLKAMSDAKAARDAAVGPLYAKAKAAAAAREAQGQFIDVKPAVKDLDEMLRLSENLPGLRGELLRLRQSVERATPKTPPAPPLGAGKVTSRMRAPIAPTAAARPLSYAELDMASRYLKDIAFGGEAEGYGALIRNAAKRLSAKLDEQIAAQVPEHSTATAKYRQLSEPMETLGTRIGGALHDTEGGLKGDAYGKVSAQDLPARIFSRKDRIEQLVDSLAGGKNATPQARAAAQAKVDTWVENWVLDKTGGAVGSEAARAVQAPGMRAALSAAPGARGRLAETFGREADMQRGVPELSNAAEAARADAASIAKRRADIRSKIEKADIDLEHGSQKAAFDAYVSSLRATMGASNPVKYRAAIALVERAGSLEAKTAKARKLAWAVAGMAGVAGVARLGLQVPGVLK